MSRTKSLGRIQSDASDTLFLPVSQSSTSICFLNYRQAFNENNKNKQKQVELFLEKAKTHRLPRPVSLLVMAEGQPPYGHDENNNGLGVRQYFNTKEVLNSATCNWLVVSNVWGCSESVGVDLSLHSYTYSLGSLTSQHPPPLPFACRAASLSLERLHFLMAALSPQPPDKQTPAQAVQVHAQAQNSHIHMHTHAQGCAVQRLAVSLHH